MKNSVYFIALLLVSIFSTSCSSNVVYNGQKDILYRDSFIKIEKTMVVSVCLEGKCQKLTQLGSTASGSVVQNRFDGSYVLTAAHVCDDSGISNYIDEVIKSQAPELLKDIRKDLLFIGKTLQGKEYIVEVVSQDVKNDICILWVEDLYKKALVVSPKPPEIGDRVYNMASPLGIYHPNMIPLQEGLYNGEQENKALYSLPAIGGSSGSPIVNVKGELVGMIHSVFTKFSHVSLSPTFTDLTDFIDSSTSKHAGNHMINTMLRQLLDSDKRPPDQK